MILDIDFNEARKGYEKWLDTLERSKVINAKEKKERRNLLSYSIWLNNEWPIYAKAVKK